VINAIPLVLLGLFLAGLLCLNIPHWRASAKMTPDERKRDYEEARDWLQLW
jgi:hypothetical protein